MTDTGTLEIRLLKEGSSEPVAGATVIRSGEAGTEALLTDGRGRVTFVIKTPPDSYALSPRVKEKPYASVDIRIISAGYLTINIFGIQVFSSINSIQQIEMIPFTDDTDGFEKVIITPPHKLYTLAPSRTEQNISALPAASVLFQRRPTIPETITVHLGTPGSNAENVTVPFLYYIKNCASSEIYPTWPEQSLDANILCIASLALNRIYTEWYRSQGYDFDITSSTAFDQSFVKDRAIFDTIDAAADRLFTSYLARSGTIEPFYAEYCDGASVICDGLSQWGTVPLARRGYNALEIVRYYYGRDIEQCTAEVMQMPPSFPGELFKGSNGEGVALLQYRLNRVAINFPSIPFIRYQDGIFGDDTETSVKAFQRVFGINETGVVNRDTWYRLVYIYNAVKKLAELGSEGEREQSDTFGGRTLQLGDRGSEVLRMQYYLHTISVVLGADIVPDLAITGVFTEDMLTSVKAFQGYYGLNETGNIPKATWDAIVETYYAVGGDSIHDDRIKEYPGYPIRRGASGESVVYIQTALSAIRNAVPSIRQIAIDGIFGSQTEAAVKEFQTYYGLDVDGIVGSLTWQAINQEYARYLS